jgi:hypothetical protein
MFIYLTSKFGAVFWHPFEPNVAFTAYQFGPVWSKGSLYDLFWVQLMLFSTVLMAIGK